MLHTGTGPYMLIVAALAVLAGAVIQGATGFGLGMVAGPILLLLDPVFVPGPLLVMAFCVSLMSTIRDRASVDYRGLMSALVGRVPGTLLAGVTMAAIPLSLYNMVFGAIIFISVLISILGFHVQASSKNLFIAGAFSGFMGTITSIGAPPMAVVLQNSPAVSVRSTLSAYFSVGAGFSIAVLYVMGLFSGVHLVLGLVYLPLLALGYWLSGHLINFLRGRFTRPILLGFASVAAVILVARAF